MGPGSSSEKERGTDPPLYSPEKDSYIWRKNVAQWVDLIVSAADQGQDKHYQTVFITLARQLFRKGLPEAQQNIVEEAQEKNLINYKQPNQVLAVKEIVDLIAVDPPIAVVTRLIDSFNKVTACKKRKGEDLTSFASRFRGLAAEHLMHAGATSSSQIGEVLSITLLNNAALSEGTLTNAKLQLIALAESRKAKNTGASVGESSSSTPSTEVAKVVADLRSMRNKLAQKLSTDISSNSMSVLQLRKAVKASLKSMNTAAEELETSMQSAAPSKTPSPYEIIMEGCSSPSQRCKLFLDDAVSVVRSLAHTTTEKEQRYTMAQVEGMVDARVQQALLSANVIPGSSQMSGNGMLSRQKKSKGQSKGKQQRNDNEHQGGSSRKRKSHDDEDIICFDCGETGYRRGDLSCRFPSYFK